MTGNIKMTVLWDVSPCSLVEYTDVSEVLPASVITALMMKAVSTSGKFPGFCKSTRCNFTEVSRLHINRLLKIE
jgi:hypothetical protein